MFDKMVGQSFDQYKITRLLGVGGMGAVFKAQDVTLQRDVAIKVMHPNLASQEDFKDRFLTEARSIARLEHPGIVNIYEFSNKGSLLYLVMKFIPGANLEQMLTGLRNQNRWISMQEAVQLVSQVALALDYAHHQGVLHRDIKASNIMIEPVPSSGAPYRPVITDLGLAKLAEGGAATQTGITVGTPAYMSPEQAEGRQLDARSDVYSLGVLLFLLTTGQLPFPAKTLSEAIFYHTKQPAPPPGSICDGFPEQLEMVILKAMEKNPATRIPTAALLAKALEGLNLPSAEITGATKLGSTVGLITQYQESLVEPRGPSIIQEFSTPPNLSKDMVQVLTGGKTIQSVPMKGEGLTVGRDPDNDIILDDTRASRHHLRIEFDGSSYRVIDQNSTNGSYLANNKLLPGIAETWQPGQALRIGNHWLRLLLSQTGAGGTSRTYVPGPGGTRIDSTRITSSAGDGRVGLYSDVAQVSIEPGQATNLKIILINQGILVDQFTLAISGIPKSWIKSGVESLQLMPGDQREVALVLLPPRASQSKAGRHPISIIVSSQEDPSQIAEIKMTLTVTAYTQISSELQPQKIRAGQTARVTIRNHGNTPETMKIDLKDVADELSFVPPQIQVEVLEGQEGLAQFQAAPRHTRWIGGEKSHPFSARVISARGEPLTLPGEMISKGRFPAWILPLIIMLCLVCAAASAFSYPILFPPPQPTQTPVPTATIEPGTPDMKIWCIFPVGQQPAQLGNCPAQVIVPKGQKVILQWQVSEAESITLAPLGNRPNEGQEEFLPLETTFFTLKATNQGKERERTIQVVVELPTSTPTIPTTPTFNVQATEQAEAQKTAAAMQTASAQAAAAEAAQATKASADATQAALDELAEEMEKFTRRWVTINPAGGMTRLYIEKVNDTTVSFHGFGQCSPTDCDWGVINVPFTPPVVTGTYDFGYKTTRIAVQLSGEKLLAEVFDDYTDADGRTDRTSNYTLQTEEEYLAEMNRWTGEWNSVNAAGGMTRLSISKLNDTTLGVRGFGDCTPTDCDWGVIQVAYNPTEMTGTWDFGWKQTVITMRMVGDQINADVFDDYSESDGRQDRLSSYVLQK